MNFAHFDSIGIEKKTGRELRGIDITFMIQGPGAGQFY